jgi:hypothetical protein
MSCNPVALLIANISEFRARIKLLQDPASAEPQFPPEVNNLIVKYDDSTLLCFAREKENPALVEFWGELSKAGEGRLRQAAKSLNLKLRIFRLIGGWTILEVHPKQPLQKYYANVLKHLGVRW